ncbi:hypothetical protein I316_03735 [Kwoniella heveanensis BCC8398]|uniref:Uncharacterized protein n=1 Tax=Kwoniella heveanensis BCC8398 TaxID=1296120 RepID=A0A1B9GUM1_9TREE|nr:hypothetical protein I316_03735 [Kwoniella heveanensis BCC8398]
MSSSASLISYFESLSLATSLSALGSGEVHAQAPTPGRAPSASPIPYKSTPVAQLRPFGMMAVSHSNPDMTERTASSSSSCLPGPSSSSAATAAGFTQTQEASQLGTERKKSQSAKRRERKKKLIAGEKERAEVGEQARAQVQTQSSASVLRAISTNVPSSSRTTQPLLKTTATTTRTNSTISTTTKAEPYTPKPRKSVYGSTSHLNDMYITPRSRLHPRISSSLATSKPLTMSYDDIDPNAGNRANAENLGGTASMHAEIENGVEVEIEVERRRRKTRRGGKRARQRRANGRQSAGDADQIDMGLLASDAESDNDTTSPTSSARTSRSGTPVRVRVQVRRGGDADDRGLITGDDGFEDGDEDGYEDEVDELSALESEIGTPQSAKSMGNKSVMSVEDAVSSIDSFLSDPRNFMTIKANKLRLWQSLCIELGLVHLAGDELPDLPTVVCVPTPPRARERERGTNGDHDFENEMGIEWRIESDQEQEQDQADAHDKDHHTQRPYMPKKSPLPQTLTQARKLLKEQAHVNLVDYLEARKYCPPAYVGAYQGLLYPSMSAMKKYTRNGGKFALRDLVRAEWLEPLMKDFGIKKGRA